MLSLLLALAVTVTMFRMGDPCCLLLVCLLAGLAWQRPCFRWWGIDGVLMCICLYDAVDFCLHPYRGIEAAEASLTGLCCYFLIRNASVESFLKLLLLPVGAALTLTFVSFGMFAEAVQGAGFADTYPFRFLFRPLGYITNAWASVWLVVSALGAIGCRLCTDTPLAYRIRAVLGSGIGCLAAFVLPRSFPCLGCLRGAYFLCLALGKATGRTACRLPLYRSKRLPAFPNGDRYDTCHGQDRFATPKHREQGKRYGEGNRSMESLSVDGYG